MQRPLQYKVYITGSTSRPTPLKKQGEKYSNIDAGEPEKPLVYFVWPNANAC